VLSAAGAAVVESTTGKDWGEQYPAPAGASGGTVWRPPKTWKHELLAAGALACLYEEGLNILPEHALRRLPEVAGLAKLPDGLAWRTGKPAAWLEVEQAEKSGRRLDELADWLVHLACGRVPAIAGQKPVIGMIVYNPDALDARGHRLNHRTRLVAKIQQRAKSDVPLIWAACQLTGNGVRELTFEHETVATSRAAQVLSVLNARGWTEEEGVQWSTYDNWTVTIWDESDDTECWAYQLEQAGHDALPANRVDTISEAKRGAANAIALID